MCECACPFAERAASVACVSVLVLCVIDTLRAAPITMRCVKCGSMSLVANRDPRRVPASFVMMKQVQGPKGGGASVFEKYTKTNEKYIT